MKTSEATRKKIARALEKSGHFSAEQVATLTAAIVAELESDEP